MGYFLWHACLRWLKTKHPKTGVRKLYREHFRRVKTRKGSMLLFSVPALDSRLKDVYVNLTNIAGLRIIEAWWSLLRVDKNPYLLEDQEYFVKSRGAGSRGLRVKRAGEYMDFNVTYSKLYKKPRNAGRRAQKGLCTICSEVLEFTDKLEVDHIKPLSQGGSNRISNKRLVHLSCHRNRIHGKGWKIG